MKKLLLYGMLVIGLLAYTVPKAEAQNVAPKGYFVTSTGVHKGLKLDTNTNVQAKSQTLAVTGYYDALLIQATLTKISGTPAGSVKLLGSVDGITYSQVSTDTLLVTNVASQSKIFNTGPSVYPYYKVTYNQTNSAAAVKWQTIFVTRKRTAGVY